MIRKPVLNFTWSEKYTTLQSNVRDILDAKVSIAAVVCYIFVLDSFAKLEYVIT